MKAKAAVFMGTHKEFEVREFEVTPAPMGYGRMELIASGICGTDLHFHNGKLAIEPPTVIGHEFVGKITDLDESEAQIYGLSVGDNVIADIAVPCGECILCKNGDDANCVNMQVTNGGSIDVPPYLYGGFAEVNYTPLSNLIKIPSDVDPIVAATFACPGPTAIHACELAKKAGDGHSNLRFIQLPYSILYPGALTHKTQSIEGQDMSMIDACHALGLTIVGSMPYAMGHGFNRFTASEMLCFALKGVDIVNIGSSNIEHISEALKQLT